MIRVIDFIDVFFNIPNSYFPLFHTQRGAQTRIDFEIHTHTHHTQHTHTIYREPGIESVYAVVL